MAEERRRAPSSLLVFLAVAALMRCPSAAAGCDLFRGRWVVDESYPLYDASTCPFVPAVFGCRRNGRPDDANLKLRWSPDGCRLPTTSTDQMRSSGGGIRLSVCLARHVLMKSAFENRNATSFFAPLLRRPVRSRPRHTLLHLLRRSYLLAGLNLLRHAAGQLEHDY
jgi:hypothetical protein